MIFRIVFLALIGMSCSVPKDLQKSNLETEFPSSHQHEETNSSFSVANMDNRNELLELFETELKKSKSYPHTTYSQDSILFFTDLTLLKDETKARFNKENTGKSFYLNCTDTKLQIYASDKTSLEQGIFYYLDHLGFRYYFPNKNWHYYPELKSIFKPIEGVFSPDYVNRRMSYSYGTGSSIAKSDFDFWKKANLIGESIPGFSGHSYDLIVKRNKKIFQNHPEYFAQKVNKGSIPQRPKFNIANEDLIDLVIKDALKRAEEAHKKYGDEFMISMDPSDGGGYCQTPECRKIGNISDQVFYLANLVAKEIQKKYPKAYIGMYAYYLYAAPPSFELEENIIVYVAAAFNKSKYNYNELLSLWNKKAKLLGIRDYFGVMDWDWDLPGKGKVTKPENANNLISNYYEHNAQFYYIETLNGWITKGLGHFIAAKTLWDTEVNSQKEINEFFVKMFPQTIEIMKPVMYGIMTYSRKIPLDKDLKQWITSALEAKNLTDEIKEQNRINDILEYLYALSLYLNRKDNDKKSYEDLFAFLNQINDNSNYASYAMRRELFKNFQNVIGKEKIPNRFSALKYSYNTKINIEEELESVLDNLDPIIFSEYNLNLDDLKFQKKSISTRSKKSGNPISFRGNHTFLLNLKKVSRFGIKTGIVEYKNLKGGVARLYAYEDNECKNSLKEIQLIPEEETFIHLGDLEAGKYWLKIFDRNEGFRITKNENVNYLILQEVTNEVNTFYRNNFTFYVPESVTNFVIRSKGASTIISPTGRKINHQKYGTRNIAVKVKTNETGYWKVQNQKGSFYIDGVPPFFAAEKNDLPIFN